MSQAVKDSIAEIDGDFCVIRHSEQTDRFIRCTLFQKVIDHCQSLEYDYSENYNNDSHETTYFGWLCNSIPGYEFEESIPTTVFTQTGNRRPYIMSHEDFDHPFVRDYYNGITKAEAEQRIRAMMGNIDQAKGTGRSKKPW